MRIKVILLFIVFIIIILKTVIVNAQTENCINNDDSQPCCNGVISTDPRLDQNDNPYAENQGRSAMINKFNWMTNEFDVYHPSANGGYTWQGGPLNITNPFFSQAEYLSHINFFHHDYPYTSDKLSFWPEEGWELLHKNNGFQLNEIDYLETTDNRKGPYFILYNKYSGVMRLFAALPASLIGVNKVKTVIMFPDPINKPVSALLSEQTNISQPLDQKTKVYMIAGSSDAPSIGDFWTSDFYMAYDPCTCHFASKLYFKFKTIQIADLELTGRAVGTSVTFDGSGNAPLQNGRDFLTSVFTDDYNRANAGILTYKNIDALAAKYKTPNMSFWEKAGIDALKAVFKGAGGALDGIFNSALGGPFNSALISSGISGLLDLKGEQKLGLGIFASFSDRVNATLFPEHKIPNIGVIEAEIALTGLYLNEESINGVETGFKLAVPGSKDTEKPNVTPWQEYPSYNEALGIFALLQKPILKKYKSTSSYSEFDTYHVKFKLDANSIKYYFNPILGINYEKSKILASIFIPDYTNQILTQSNHLFSSSTLVTDLNQTINITQNPNFNYYYSAFYPIGCLDNIVLDLFQGIPHEEFQETKLYNWDNNSSPLIKFLIYLEYSPNKYGVVNKSVLEFTYPMIMEEVETNFESSSDINVPFDIQCVSKNWNEQYTANSWNDIMIVNSNLSTNQNVQVDLIAGKRILIKPNSKITPNIQLKIGPPNGCSGISPVSDSYIKSFCTSTNYKANQIDESVKNQVESIQNFKRSSMPINNSVSFHISPNPASNILNISYSLPEISDTKIVISNLLGEELITVLDERNHNAGGFKKNIDITKLNSGTYFVTLISNGFRFNKNLMIIK